MQMDAFQKYLYNKRLVTEKTAPYFVAWVTECYAFTEEEPDTKLNEKQVAAFLNHLIRSKEDWQVTQARETIVLYVHYLQFHEMPFGGRSRDKDQMWVQAVDAMKSVLCLKHMALTTERTYIGWVPSFFTFLKWKTPDELSTDDFKLFINHLAIDRKVARSTQNQAFNAILFFYRHGLSLDPGDIGLTLRAHNKKRLPVVLSQNEIQQLFDRMKGTNGLMVRLIYGRGMRLSECLRLRVKDLDFERGCLTVLWWKRR